MAPGAPRRLNLSIFGPWPPNAPRRPPEGSLWAFSSLGRQMASGSDQEAYFEHRFRERTVKTDTWRAPGAGTLVIYGVLREKIIGNRGDTVNIEEK